MYSYTYDKETGGIILNSSPTGFSKEPRPVYAKELDILGFDRYWKYDKQIDLPYLWAEANNYWYRGKHVAKLKGGNLNTAPEIIITVEEDGSPIFPEPNGNSMRPVDIEGMVEKNKDMMEIIEQTTVKKIFEIFKRYKKKVDLFHVAYSGGKDSEVLLDLVKKSLPKGSFVVVFADTGMEFPDTYEVIEKTQVRCKKEGIPFHVAQSHLGPEESWKLFGPPSRHLRWCCSVHKGAPQALKLREISDKNDYIGMAFVGVRSHESAVRAGYEYENYGKKQKGQFSHNSILEWTSAEVWLYIYANRLIINNAYKGGNSRVGCIFCPMSINKADFIIQKLYPDDLKLYIDLIMKSSGRNYGDGTFITKGGWVSRRSGRDLADNTMNYTEKILDNNLIISVSAPKTDWKEWIKTLEDHDTIPLSINENDNGYKVKLPVSFIKENPTKGKLIKQVFRKSAYCIRCRVCEANCRHGNLKFEEMLKIANCTNCLECHEIEYGCYMYNSRRIPKEGKSMSVNSFDSTLPKNSWFGRFFDKKGDYWEEHGLGPNQVKTFKCFLSHSGLTINGEYTKFASLIRELGWETDTSWGIILINLAERNPQFQWYIKNLEVNKQYTRNEVISMLLEVNKSNNVVKMVYNAYKKLIKLPLGTSLRFGYVTDKGDLVRTKCNISDPKVVLYGLFKFAEKCNDYKEFTLATLLNDSIDRDGISPTQIFGLDREDMIPMLIGLTAKYPDYITASFTHDLEKISLAIDKTSSDILNLFKEENING